MPAELQDPGAPSTWDEHKYKFLPNRTDIAYHDNAGYSLTSTTCPGVRRHLPSSAIASVKRRLSSWLRRLRVAANR
jgi:hypothetical protein